MFEAAASMSSDRLLSVAYYTRIALEHCFTPEDLRKYPLLAGTSGEPSPEEQEIACQWLEEIQNQEGKSIDRLDYGTVARYISEVVGLSQRRWESERTYDPQEGQRLLEELRRAVPLPWELRKAG
ncbi:MAG TPA: hypothetical protein VKK31_01295 [Thermoanaerobaculia bacterium]|nr:hypothetical protein [Thermoanaerobaculia bacterium]